MENEVKLIEDDDFPEEFQCCICLDLLYKPIVLACGHMACFWCMYHTMDFWQESHCPLCRHSFNHFPRVCTLLHSLLLKLYPLTHERRQKQVAEEEKISGTVSQQLNKAVSTSLKGESSSDSSSKNGSIEGESSNGTHKMMDIDDLTCAICKQLICRPVVLNCGDVYCEACIIDSVDNNNNKVCKCPVCESPHPNGFPSVCLILDHFLDEHFPLQYATRKETSTKRDDIDLKPLKDIQESQEKRSGLTNMYAMYLTGQGPKVHPSAGCDYCGMCPIIGERYRCKDCKEKIGFDLCEGCYNSSCKLPGRFNQQHTEDHQFEIVEPLFVENILLGMRAALENVSSNNTTDNDDTDDGGDSAQPERTD